MGRNSRRKGRVLEREVVDAPILNGRPPVWSGDPWEGTTFGLGTGSCCNNGNSQRTLFGQDCCRRCLSRWGVNYRVNLQCGWSWDGGVD